MTRHFMRYFVAMLAAAVCCGGVARAATVADSCQVVVVSADTAMGWVEGGGWYAVGDTVTFAAHANVGHHFVTWSDGQTDESRWVTVTADCSYIAFFAEDDSSYLQGCTYTIEMHDSYGDGWNGASMTLYVGDVSLGTYSLSDSYDDRYYRSETFYGNGLPVHIVWNGGYYDGECSFFIKDANGGTVLSGIGEWYPAGYSWQNATGILFSIYDAFGGLLSQSLFPYSRSTGGQSSQELYSVPMPCFADTSAINRLTFPDYEHGHIEVTMGGIQLASGTTMVQNTEIVIKAIPNGPYALRVLVVNGDTVPSPYNYVVSGNVDVSAEFELRLPELHVSALAASDAVAGQTMHVQWTVRNDGGYPTPTGTTWTDYLYLSPVPYVIDDAEASGDALLLGSWENVSALDAGESYTRSVDVTIPLRHASGRFYVVALADAASAYDVEWGGASADSYSPPPYAMARTGRGSEVDEVSEVEHPGWHDNFNLVPVNVAIPPLPDLEVTAITRPSTFYSGTTVSVVATVANSGDAPTRSSGWRDVLYISRQPEFSGSALQLASVWHDGSEPLSQGESYQVQFAATVPLTWYGEAWFYVCTDPDDSEYEHVANDNNTSRSEAVNIILTPPADLVVGRLEGPAVASNQLPVRLSWTVHNEGLGAPNVASWRDDIYLSTSPQLTNEYALGGDEWHYLLESRYHSGGLPAGEGYTESREYMLPEFLAEADTFWFIIVADAGGDVFEYESEDNNSAVSGACLASFFFPDLVVDSIVVPDSVDNLHPFAVSYTVSNVGTGKAAGGWQDKLWIDGLGLATQTHSATLMPGESYSATVQCSLPAGIGQSGWRSLTVMADWRNQVSEPDGEQNNSRSATTHATVYKPDLVPVRLSLPDTIVAGHSLGLGFDVANLGQRDYSATVDFTVYYSADAVLDMQYGYPTNASVLYGGTYSWNHMAVPIGGRWHEERTVQFDQGVADGDYYVHIALNPTDDEDRTDNNTLCGGPYHVCHRPLPDLAVGNLHLPDTLRAGQTVSISFDVVNNGEVTELAPANIYGARFLTSLMADGAWCPVQMQVSPFPAGRLTLAVGDTMHFVQTVTMPPSLAGSVVFTLAVDAENNIMELDEGNNSVVVAGTVQPHEADIAVVQLAAPPQWTTGDTVTVAYRVQTTGLQPTYRSATRSFADATGYIGHANYSVADSDSLWTDRLYLSADTILSADDLLLGSHVASIDSNGGYEHSFVVAMPHSRSGNVNLILVADREERVIEADKANNRLAQPAIATLAPLPNLTVAALALDDTATQRQGIMVYYTVKNTGEAAAVGPWVDRITVGSLSVEVEHAEPLQPGESYTDSVYAVVPSGMIGLYLLRAMTDAHNDVYEHDHEDDNIMARPLLVQQAMPCDLVVTDLQLPPAVTTAQPIDLAWTVQNIGENTVSGYVKDGIYLSTDTVYDPSDVLIGTSSYRATLEAQGSTMRSAQCRIRGVEAGQYHIIVRTNIMRAFLENSFDNNTRPSVATVEVTMPTLYIGEAELVEVASGGEVYYRLGVPAELEGQTLSVTLGTEATNAFNALYLAHEEMPTPARHDFGTAIPYAATQQLLVPKLQQGIYYLMASASTVSREAQTLTLLAEIVDFEILHVATAKGTNTGSVTTRVTGAKFDTIMDFRLTAPDGSYTPAQKVRFDNSTQSYVTFNLTDLQAGTYGIEAELPGGVLTLKAGAFVVEEGLPAELAVNIVAPGSVRSGNSTTLNIEYGNNGQTDLDVSGFMVVSAGGHPIALTAAGLDEERDTLTFATAEEGMDPDILRPGYFATKTIFVRASSTNTISIYVYPIRRRYE